MGPGLSRVRSAFILMMVFAGATLGAEACAFADSVNITAGQPRGGFGDIASNLLMAEHMKSARPDRTINIIMTSENEEMVRRLYPSLQPGAPMQTVGGLNFYRAGVIQLPRADYSLGFSIESVPMPVIDSAPVSLGFHEYGSRPGRFVEISNQTPGTPELRFNTGAAGSGFYINPEPTAAPGTREELLKEIAKFAPELDESFRQPDTLIAFSYTSKRETSVQYLKSLAEVASNSIRYHGKKILVFAGTPEESAQLAAEVSLPPNVKLVAYDKMSFDLTRKLIAHSDIPVMVTGDVSMTLALDYNKAFFYEMNPWKEAAIDGLIKALKANSPQDEKSSRFFANLAKAWKIESATLAQSQKDMTLLLKDFTFDQEMKAALQGCRAELSLPARLDRYLGALKSIDLKFAKNATLEKFFTKIAAGADAKSVAQAWIEDGKRIAESKEPAAVLDRLSLLDWKAYPEAEKAVSSMRQGSEDLKELAQALLHQKWERGDGAAVTLRAKVRSCFLQRLSSSPLVSSHSK